MRVILLFSFVILVSWMSGGCVSTPSSEREAALKKQVNELENTIRKQNFKVEDLNNKLTLLTFNKRRVSSHVDAAEGADLPGVSIAVDESANETHDSPRKSVTAHLKPESAISTEPQALYFGALSKIKNHHLEEGRKVLVEFIKKYPTHVLADDAFFHLGKIYLAQKQYERAVFHFKQMQQLYPDGDKLLSGDLELAAALRGLKRDGEASEVLQKLVRQYPGSEQAQVAEKALQNKTLTGEG